MIFGVILSNKEYADFYPELLAFVQRHFAEVRSGLQGDAWIWIERGDERVALDTFSAMQFEIKSNRASRQLLELVISKLKSAFDLDIYAEPELEAHE